MKLPVIRQFYQNQTPENLQNMQRILPGRYLCSSDRSFWLLQRLPARPVIRGHVWRFRRNPGRLYRRKQN